MLLVEKCTKSIRVWITITIKVHHSNDHNIGLIKDQGRNDIFCYIIILQNIRVVKQILKVTSYTRFYAPIIIYDLIIYLKTRYKICCVYFLLLKSFCVWFYHQYPVH